METSAGRTAEQIELERFLLEDLPRRQEGDPSRWAGSTPRS
ncbi:hypothetical protein [Tessaracoccus coleopterorum]|nr:hypothetical protein [Tessaracoccus coleopterorum]